MPFWPSSDPGEIIDSFKERYGGRSGPPPTISRLEAACLRFRRPSLFGYRRSDVERLQAQAIAALAERESGRITEAPDLKLRRGLFGVSPREVGEFRQRVVTTLSSPT